MYMMRVDQASATLLIECSGRLSTDEAIRAVTHAYALAAAGDIHAIACDLSAVRHGPPASTPIAAVIASLHRTDLRTAVVVGRRGSGQVQQLLDLAGMDTGVKIFEDVGSARAWLMGAETDNLSYIGGTEARHLAGPLFGTFSATMTKRRLRKSGAA